MELKASTRARRPSADPAQMLREANRLYEVGQYRAAEALFARLLQDARNPAWCLFQLGRIAARLGDLKGAIQKLDEALAHKDAVGWAYYERAAAALQLGEDGAAATADLLRFIQLDIGELGKPHYATILRGAHAAFNAKQYDEATQLYDFLIARQQGGYSARLRRADIWLRKDNAAEAQRLLAELAGDPAFDQWGHFLHGQAYLKTEQVANAVQSFEQAVARAPDNPAFLGQLLLALELSDDKAGLKKYQVNIARQPEDKQFDLLLRAKLGARKYDEIAALYTRYPPEVTAKLRNLVAANIHQLSKSEEWEAIRKLIAATHAAESGAGHIVCAGIASFFATKDWASAENLIKSAEGILDAAGDPEFRIRKLEYFCFTMQHDKALQYLGQWQGDRRTMPSAGSSVVAALYAAVGQWDDVIEFFEERVTGEFPVHNELLLESVTRAARRTRRHAHVLGLLDRALTTVKHELLADYRDILASEMHVLRSLEPETVAAVAPEALHIAEPFRASRASFLRELLDGRPATQCQGTIFFCTDLNYLLGSCVALYSLLHSNVTAARRYAFRMYCAEEGLELARSVCEDLASAFSARIAVISSSSLIQDGHSFRTGWGMFTPGAGLSVAAYYRIFAAQQLLREGGGRALYLDADMLIGMGIDELFGADLQGQPLGAVPELPLREIHHAADKLGVARETYFNSGMLLFDLEHPELPPALERAVDLAVNQHEMLSFVDQCALNSAFYKRVRLLGKDFNFFVREKDAVPMLAREPVVTHYLDRPKPWDPTYRSINCRRWVGEFAGLCELVGAERMRRMMSIVIARSPAQAQGQARIKPPGDAPLEVSARPAQAPPPAAGRGKKRSAAPASKAAAAPRRRR